MPDLKATSKTKICYFGCLMIHTLDTVTLDKVNVINSVIIICILMIIVASEPHPGGGGGGGHSGTEGCGTRVTYFAEEGVFYLRPPHVRDFVKEGYFFVPRYEVCGSKSPYNPRNIRGSDAE